MNGRAETIRRIIAKNPGIRSDELVGKVLQMDSCANRNAISSAVNRLLAIDEIAREDSGEKNANGSTLYFFTIVEKKPVEISEAMIDWLYRIMYDFVRTPMPEVV